MKAGGIFETVLYAPDLQAAKWFYQNILGLTLLSESELVLVFRLSQSVLLIFNPDLSGIEDRPVPSHGNSGPGHLAFSATDGELDLWKSHFEREGVKIEKIHQWEAGGRSLYVRDPAQNSIEFAPSTLWGGNWDSG